MKKMNSFKNMQREIILEILFVSLKKILLYSMCYINWSKTFFKSHYQRKKLKSPLLEWQRLLFVIRFAEVTFVIAVSPEVIFTIVSCSSIRVCRTPGTVSISPGALGKSLTLVDEWEDTGDTIQSQAN